MELGDLEVEILQVLDELGESRPHELHRVLQRKRPVAYTTVTNTLYRLVEKGLVRVRRTGPKRAFYSPSKDATTRTQIASRLLSRLVRAFGSDAVSRLIEADSVSPKSRSKRRR